MEALNLGKIKLSFPSIPSPSKTLLSKTSLKPPIFPKPLHTTSISHNSQFSTSLPLSSPTHKTCHTYSSSSSSHKPPQNPPFSLLKSISLSIAAAALFFSRFPPHPSFAAPVSSPTPPTIETDSETDRERSLESHLISHPDDTDALKSLMETKIKLRKLSEAIDAIDRLIALQPQEKEWPLLRAHLHLYGGDVDTAKSAFEDIISADPFRVEAYHGLAMAFMQFEPEELDALLMRVQDVMENCKKEKKMDDLRDFKLLVAQVRVMEGKYEEALRLYQELVRDEPKDFRPYLCLGIIYTLMGKNNDAEKQFAKYRQLVPKGHPYAQYFDENVVASKIFSQMAEKEKAGSNR